MERKNQIITIIALIILSANVGFSNVLFVIAPTVIEYKTKELQMRAKAKAEAIKRGQPLEIEVIRVAEMFIWSSVILFQITAWRFGTTMGIWSPRPEKANDCCRKPFGSQDGRLFFLDQARRRRKYLNSTEFTTYLSARFFDNTTLRNT